MNILTIPGGLCSTDHIRQFARNAGKGPVALMFHPSSQIVLSENAWRRMSTVLADSGAPMVYADFHTGDEPTPCIDCREGALRDDFCFGPVAAVDAEALLRAIDSAGSDYDHAGWYAVRLALMRMSLPVRIPEYLSVYRPEAAAADGERHFDYVDPRNRRVQMEMEHACTEHLKAISAWLPPRTATVDFGGDFPVEMSVIIPVRNRVSTIADAVNSALAQTPDFSFNVIVVDNHSTDGTTEALQSISDKRLVHIVPDSTGLGIGGCWNTALHDSRCGRFAVQLDSDDLYSSADTLTAIHRCFLSTGCAMAVGSYSLVDFDCRPIPPGVIDHREWTDANGHNNLLRVNGMGAPRAFATAVARSMPMPDVSYGEDYAMALRMSRQYRIGRIFDVLYLCRRWGGNSDSSLTTEKANRFNTYKDSLRTWEIAARRQLNK